MPSFEILVRAIKKKVKQKRRLAIEEARRRREELKQITKRVAEPRSLFGRTQRAIEEREKRLKR